MSMLFSRTFWVRVSCCVVVALFAAQSAKAGITNGSFDSGLSNWTVTTTGGGSVTAVTTRAVVGASGETVVGSGGLTSWVPQHQSQFALLAGTGDAQTQTLSQVFTADESGSLSFSYFFDSAETGVTWNDSFQLRIGTWNGSSFGTDLYNNTHTTSSLTPNSGNTGWVSGSVNLVANTQYRILGTLINPLDNFNIGRSGGDQAIAASIAGMDRFNFTPPPAVPEPTSVSLLLLGGLGLAWRQRRTLKQGLAKALRLKMAE